MSKSLNLSKVLLASLAPIIAHQTTYAAQQINIPQGQGQQQVPEPIQLNGAVLPNAAQVQINQQAYNPNNVPGISAQDFTALSNTPNLASTVASAIAGWKDKIANQQQPPQWAQNTLNVLTANVQNVDPKLQVLKKAFHAATLITVRNGQGNGQIANQNQLREQANAAAADVIFTKLRALAKALYDFKENIEQPGNLDSLKFVYKLIECRDQITIQGQNSQVDNINQNQAASVKALKDKIQEDIDEFIATLHEWNPAPKVSFNDRDAARQQLNLDIHDTDAGLEKFEQYKEQICGDLNDYITLDQFYQFNKTQEHLQDLDQLEPEAFVNPNIQNLKVFANNALYIQNVANVRAAAREHVENELNKYRILEGSDLTLMTTAKAEIIKTVNADFTLSNYNTAKNTHTRAARGEALDENNTIGQNFRKTMTKLKKAIANKLAEETESSISMVNEYLESDNGLNNNATIFDTIKGISLNNNTYANIDSIDELAAAILNAFHNQQNQFSIQNLKEGPLAAIKLSDTTFYKSTQPDQNQDGEIPDPIADTIVSGYESYITQMLGLNLDYDKIYIPSENNNGDHNDINDKEGFLKALAANYP